MEVRELRVVHGTQQSFYKKAFVKEDKLGNQYLYSNYKIIITNYNGGKALKFAEDINLYSNTTMRHVREYLWQIGKGELAALPKAKFLKKITNKKYVM